MSACYTDPVPRRSRPGRKKLELHPLVPVLACLALWVAFEFLRAECVAAGGSCAPILRF